MHRLSFLFEFFFFFQFYLIFALHNPINLPTSHSLFSSEFHRAHSSASFLQNKECSSEINSRCSHYSSYPNCKKNWLCALLCLTEQAFDISEKCFALLPCHLDLKQFCTEYPSKNQLVTGCLHQYASELSTPCRIAIPCLQNTDIPCIFPLPFLPYHLSSNSPGKDKIRFRLKIHLHNLRKLIHNRSQPPLSPHFDSSSFVHPPSKSLTHSPISTSGNQSNFKPKNSSIFSTPLMIFVVSICSIIIIIMFLRFAYVFRP